MACSYCREKGHTKRNCPKQREEKIKIQRDRTNMFISVFPALIANPVTMGLIWWQLSKLHPATRFFNSVVMGGVAADILPFVDVDIQALPPALVMGSGLQVAEDSKSYIDFLKEWQGAEYTPTGTDPIFLGSGLSQQALPVLLNKFFTWLSEYDYEPPKVKLY